MSVHEENKVFVCQICLASFRTKGQLKSHLERIHEKIKRFHCSTCGVKFYDKADWKKHENRCMKSQ